MMSSRGISSLLLLLNCQHRHRHIFLKVTASSSSSVAARRTPVRSLFTKIQTIRQNASLKLSSTTTTASAVEARRKSIIESSISPFIDYSNRRCIVTTATSNNVEVGEKPASPHDDSDAASTNKVLTIPNGLTTLRILSSPFISYLVLIDQHEAACALFVASGVTDFLDGYIARNWPGQKSYLGSILDPLADKLLIGTLTITLAASGMMPIELAALILSRDLTLILASLVVRYRTLEKPITLAKYINVGKYASVQVEADQISKINTAFQIALIAFTLPSEIFAYNDSLLLHCLQGVTAVTTALSSLSYLLKGGSYKLVSKSK